MEAQEVTETPTDKTTVITNVETDDIIETSEETEKKKDDGEPVTAA